MNEALISRLHAADSVAITSHISPDGDAIGSTLALARALRFLGKRVTVAAHDALPEDFTFLPDSDRWNAPAPDLPTQDVCVMLDVCNDKRVGSAAAVWREARARACVDHHLANPNPDVLAFLDPASPSCAQLVLQVIDALDVPVDPELATLLFTGISTDTGHFMNPNATPAAFRDAARLAEHGARVREIAVHIYQQRSLAKTRLLARCLSSLEMRLEDHVAITSLTLLDYADCGAVDSDTEGLVNYALAIPGVEVSLLARETAGGDIRMNMRSTDAVNVAEVCRDFGGGGHLRAAGCTLRGVSIGEAKEAVLAAVGRKLEA